MPDLNRRRLGLAALVVVGVAAALLATSPVGPLAGLLHPLDYERTTVTVTDADGTTLASVDVRVADTTRERYVGLSETASLADSEGMLFVFEESGERAFVMRGMGFPLDIVFADPDGRITTIHHAPVPGNTPGSELRRYRGTARFVLEVPRGYANRSGFGVGDRLRVPANVTEP